MSKSEDESRKAFKNLFSKPAWFTIERTDYIARPFRLIVWSDKNGLETQIVSLLLTGDELVELSDLILNHITSHE